MFILIKRDLKQKIKNPLTWFIILILCIMSLLNIVEMKEKRLDRPFKGHDIDLLAVRGSFNWSQFFDEREKKLNPKAYYSRCILDKVEKDIIKAVEENNIKEITRLRSFYNLLWAKSESVTNDVIMNTVFEKKAIDIWDDVSGGIEYEDIDFYPSGFTDFKFGTLVIAKYYHQLYQNNLEPVYSDDINNVTYLYDYLFTIVPNLILVICIMFIYNIINREKNTGSLKLIITQSTSRWKYYISKWISGLIHVIFVIILPAVSISTILGVLNGFVSMKYPTLYLKGTMTNFKPIVNYLDAAKVSLGFYPKLIGFSYYAPVSKVVQNLLPVHGKVEVIPFYKYLLMVVLLTILFIGFAVALIQLISAIINKELISFVVVSLIFVVGTLVSTPYKYEKHLNLSPFTMENASRIVIGTYNVTALTSIIILLFSTILLLFIGCKYFKKKEI